MNSPSTLADVDAALVKLARDLNGRLMTNDFNLNRVASVEAIPVLNINDLVNAIKPIYTGDTLDVRITKRGKEPQQGVGYLEDGTMVVIENGIGLINTTATVTVNSVLQTSSGRMIFASAGSLDLGNSSDGNADGGDGERRTGS